MTAPLGALATSLLGPVLLKKKDMTESEIASQPTKVKPEFEDEIKDQFPSEANINGISGLYEGNFMCAILTVM